VYCYYKGLEFGKESAPAQGLQLPLSSVGEQFRAFFREKIVFYEMFSAQFGQHLENLALKFDCQAMFNTQCFSWAKALGGLMLDEEGKVFWAGLASSSGHDSESLDSCSSLLSQESEVDSGAVHTARRRGHPRKQATPQVESQVKRSLRSNSQGYNHTMLPYLTSKPKTSSVKVATPPEVLQVEEMQRIGVEECFIDPAALTREKLMKQREDHA
jgi:hypothetical protein